MEEAKTGFQGPAESPHLLAADPVAQREAADLAVERRGKANVIRNWAAVALAGFVTLAGCRPTSEPQVPAAVPVASVKDINKSSSTVVEPWSPTVDPWAGKEEKNKGGVKKNKPPKPNPKIVEPNWYIPPKNILPFDKEESAQDFEIPKQ